MKEQLFLALWLAIMQLSQTRVFFWTCNILCCFARHDQVCLHLHSHCFLHACFVLDAIWMVNSSIPNHRNISEWYVNRYWLIKRLCEHYLSTSITRQQCCTLDSDSHSDNTKINFIIPFSKKSDTGMQNTGPNLGIAIA